MHNIIPEYRRVPWFYPVPSGVRHDGWSAERQTCFIGYLRQTGSVTEAAKRVSMSRQNAYRLRTRKWAESFAAAWDAALDRTLFPPHTRNPGRKAKATSEELIWRFETGLWRPVLRNRHFVRVARKPCNTSLLQLLARLDARQSQAPWPEFDDNA